MRAYANLISSMMLAVLASAVTMDVLWMIDEFSVAFSFRGFVVLPTMFVCSLGLTLSVCSDVRKRFKQVCQ